MTGSIRIQSTRDSAIRLLKVETLWDMDFVGPDGQPAGTILNAVESTTTGRQFVVIRHGGFLGFGGKEIAVPSEALIVEGGKVVLRGMPAGQLDRLPEYESDSGRYRELAGAERISLAEE